MDRTACAAMIRVHQPHSPRQNRPALADRPHGRLSFVPWSFWAILPALLADSEGCCGELEREALAAFVAILPMTGLSSTVVGHADGNGYSRYLWDAINGSVGGWKVKN
jgi:hypothetical protein